MTNYKQLCAELLEWAERTSSHYYKQADVIVRARAALAEPEPEGPTDKEIMMLMPQEMHADLAAAARAMTEQAGTDSTRVKGLHRIILNRHAVDLARAVLARWGNHPGSPDSLSHPVPVSERLPGPGDCNSDGDVWAWRRFDPEGDMDNGDHWCLAFREWLEDEDCGFTHWLPAHALPQPSSPSH